MGRNKKNKYRIVTVLPDNAMKVSDYAKEWPCNTSYLYKLVAKSKEKNKKIPFEIIEFKGINFIVDN